METIEGTAVYGPSVLQHVNGLVIPGGQEAHTVNYTCGRRCTYIPLGGMTPQPVRVAGYTFHGHHFMTGGFIVTTATCPNRALPQGFMVPSGVSAPARLSCINCRGMLVCCAQWAASKRCRCTLTTDVLCSPVFVAPGGWLSLSQVASAPSRPCRSSWRSGSSLRAPSEPWTSTTCSWTQVGWVKGWRKGTSKIKLLCWVGLGGGAREQAEPVKLPYCACKQSNYCACQSTSLHVLAEKKDGGRQALARTDVDANVNQPPAVVVCLSAGGSSGVVQSASPGGMCSGCGRWGVRTSPACFSMWYSSAGPFQHKPCLSHSIPAVHIDTGMSSCTNPVCLTAFFCPAVHTSNRSQPAHCHTDAAGVCSGGEQPAVCAADATGAGRGLWGGAHMLVCLPVRSQATDS